MIEFNNLSKQRPYLIFKDKYDEALISGQKNIEAVSISSYNKKSKEVDSRFVNLKYIIDKDFIFFSNYQSQKNLAFESHNQIAALFYWPSINSQIRIKAVIKKTSDKFNQSYFKKRDFKKNALAISSNQSNIISDYDEVVTNYEHVLRNSNLKNCPKYWGGFSFTPYSIEFWEGHDSRLNKRDLYIKKQGNWNHSVLEP
jgi:pyridoxamine 5'-phosphate oxidase